MPVLGKYCEGGTGMSEAWKTQPSENRGETLPPRKTAGRGPQPPPRADTPGFFLVGAEGHRHGASDAKKFGKTLPAGLHLGNHMSPEPQITPSAPLAWVPWKNMPVNTPLPLSLCHHLAEKPPP